MTGNFSVVSTWKSANIILSGSNSQGDVPKINGEPQNKNSTSEIGADGRPTGAGALISSYPESMLVPLSLLKTSITLYKLSRTSTIKYHPSLTKRDTYHNFPNSFDQHIINNGTWSQRIKDAANWYEIPGNINGVDGMYRIGINQDKVIFHRDFIPIIP